MAPWRPLQEALDLAEGLDQDDSLGAVLIALGTLYDELENLEQSLEYYSQAYRWFEERDLPLGEATALANVGEICGRLGRYDEVFEYFERSLAVESPPGEGSTFSFSLPIAEESTKAGDVEAAIHPHVAEAHPIPVEPSPESEELSAPLDSGAAETYSQLEAFFLKLHSLLELEPSCAKGLVRGLAAGRRQTGPFCCQLDSHLAFVIGAGSTLDEPLALHPQQQWGHRRFAELDSLRQSLDGYVIFFPQGHHDDELRIRQAERLEKRSVSLSQRVRRGIQGVAKLLIELGSARSCRGRH